MRNVASLRRNGLECEPPRWHFAQTTHLDSATDNEKQSWRCSRTHSEGSEDVNLSEIDFWPSMLAKDEVQSPGVTFRVSSRGSASQGAA